MEPPVTVTSPPVKLQTGTAGNSTIYTNNTSANVNVTAPLFDYVDNDNSDEDSSADKGTHSNFTAQQYSDLINDTLTEADQAPISDSENFVDNNSSNVDNHADHGTSSNFTAQQDSNVLYNDTLTEADTGGTPTTLSKNPTANSAGTYPWTNPSYGYTSNNQYATAVATIPIWRSTGAMAHSTTSAITPALPGSMSVNDIVILVACCYTGGTIAITASGSITTWNALTGTPVDVALGDKLYVWWGRWSSGSTGVTLTPTSGNHIVGRTVAFYNCYTGGSPIDVSATGTETTSDVSFNFATGLTTTYNNEVCVCVCSTTYDPTSDSTSAFGTMTNGNLAGINERMDNDVNEGNGGGFGLDHGTLIINGAMGTFASTLAYASPKSYIAFALRSTVPNNTFDQIYGTFGITGSGTITKVEIGYEAYSSVAQQLDLYTSTNGGSTWNAIHTTANLGTSDPNAYTYIDVTSDTTWTWTLLNDANFKYKVVTHWLSGTSTWYVDALVVRITYTPVNYEFDYEFSWTTASFSEVNEYLCIRTNTFAGTAENLGVDVWTGTPAAWVSISSALTASQWNNISISSYLNQSTMYFRFIGKTESSDTAQNTWSVECNLIHVWSVGINYELDLEEQFTSANFSRTNEELCIRMGAMNGETLSVQWWNATGSSWLTIIASLTANDWNNVSVTSYLTSATFTIRYKGGTETGDTNQGSWQIDAALLHVWTESTYDHVLQVVNQVDDNWTINLQVYDTSNIVPRLLKTTISFHDGTSSDQIIVNDGAVTQTEGPPYSLTGNATVYISVSNLQSINAETSYLYVYLKIRIPNTTTYLLYVITFEIT
jgi:hypothetical protein